MAAPRIGRLTVYPVKGLEGTDLEAAEVLPGGTLEFDRECALFEDEEVLNGKQTARVHEVDADFDPATRTLTAAVDGERASFSLAEAADRERAAEWFGEVFDRELTLKRDGDLGYVDRRGMGPSVVSTATLRELASWFEDLTVEGARRRLRANVEVSGVEPFWEDRFVGDGAPAFGADGVRFEGVTPCARCVVPSRDPDTGDPLPEFRQRFIEKRRETFPEWADDAAFDHFFTLMLIARVPEADRGETVAVGDRVRVVE
jgi:uncharacterized protein YcbX